MMMININKEVVNVLSSTEELEISVPKAPEDLANQGIHCQCFDNKSWNKIHYTEVQKKLQATPFFSLIR